MYINKPTQIALTNNIFMDFIEKLQAISDRITKLKDQVQTEEATKNAFVMPFISALGYDIFNPMEVIPEYNADIGTKKGEKVDYCITHEAEPIIIIECKHWKEKLDIHKSQLHRYFHVTKVRFAILTNGINYQFFTDLDSSNIMDDVPFFEVSLSNLTESKVDELKKFQKVSFNIDQILSTASDLKYSKAIKEKLFSELKNPSEDFVKYFAKRVYKGAVTSKVKDQFTSLVQKSAKQLISEMISDRLKIALNNEKEINNNDSNGQEENKIIEISPEKNIITTEEELQGFRVVQAILMEEVDINRVCHRDMKSYFGILLDDNNRKPICRLHFNRSQKYLGVFDESKNETRIPIQKIEEIYQHKDSLINVIKSYDQE